MDHDISVGLSFLLMGFHCLHNPCAANYGAYAKTVPGKLTMASGGVGTPSRLEGELFKTMTGVDMLHVPYRGTALSLTDLLGGQVQVTFTSMS